MKRLVLELDDKEHQAIKLKATQQGKAMREILRELLKKWLKK